MCRTATQGSISELPIRGALERHGSNKLHMRPDVGLHTAGGAGAWSPREIWTTWTSTHMRARYVLACYLRIAYWSLAATGRRAPLTASAHLGSHAGR